MIHTTQTVLLLFRFFSIISTQSAFLRLSQEHKSLCSCEGAGRTPREAPEWSMESGATSLVEIFRTTGQPKLSSMEMPCCGYCSCHHYCWYRGNCCLISYSDFNDAAEYSEQKIFTCSNIQLYPTDEANLRTDEMYWMVSKCRRPVKDKRIKEMCEHPPNDDDSFESVYPILSTETEYFYKNRYCAICDGIDPASIIDSHWTLDVSCGDFISVATDNLLKKLKKENCTIISVPPDKENMIYDNICYLPPFQISQCNVTGKWSKYDKDVELACKSYTDPFNSTYKNYHCYVCNVATPEPVIDWKCHAIQENTPGAETFQVSFDRHGIRLLEATSRLNCDTSTQFVDYKKSICRDISCPPTRKLSNGKCVPNQSDRQMCVGVYLKLTPNTDSDHLLWYHLRNASYTTHLVNEVVENVTGSYHASLGKCIVFHEETTASYEGIVAEFFIYAEFNVDVEHMDGLATRLYDADGKTIMLPQGNDKTSQIVWYHINLDYLNITNYKDKTVFAEMIIPYQEESITIGKYVVLWRNGLDDSECQKSESIQFSKTTTCPYIEINLDELPMYIATDGALKPTASIQTSVSFSRFHYQLLGNKVYMCLQDYITLYQFIPMPLFIEPESIVNAGYQILRLRAYMMLFGLGMAL